MSELTTEKKTIEDLFKKGFFLIPDYQRPYAWTLDECETLWEDIYAFAIPDNNCDSFDSERDEYFLGPIVTFKNEDGQSEVIDGQQRLTTIMLLLRALYDRFANMQDETAKDIYKTIGKCIWKTSELGQPDTNRPKIDSEVASDDAKDEFQKILETAEVDPSWKSTYAINFRFFQHKVHDLVNALPTYIYYFALRLLNNVILLPIEAESQDTALRIFSTLNDRGLPLSDADIFKSQLYKFYSNRGEKDEFIERWRKLEEITGDIFHPRKGTPMDELFTRYMYYLRARDEIKDTTTPSLRGFYSQNKYAVLNKEGTLDDLEALADFWKRVDASFDGFSELVARELYVLNFAPNGMWTYLVSVYFLANRDSDNGLEDEAFYQFLRLIIGFIYAYAIYRPGVNSLRAPVFPEMINIVNRREVTFANYRFDRSDISQRFRSYEFSNGRAVTKSILVWWAFFSEPNQEVLDPDAKIEIEHIYARKRNEIQPLKDPSLVEALGNKAILEKRINIGASNYSFEDKKRFYLGKVGKKEPTFNKELIELAESENDFTEKDIVERTDFIIDSFVEYLGELGLLQDGPRGVGSAKPKVEVEAKAAPEPPTAPEPSTVPAPPTASESPVAQEAPAETPEPTVPSSTAGTPPILGLSDETVEKSAAPEWIILDHRNGRTRSEYWDGFYRWCSNIPEFERVFGDMSSRKLNRDVESNFGKGLQSHGVNLIIRIDPKKQLIHLRVKCTDPDAYSKVYARWADFEALTKELAPAKLSVENAEKSRFITITCAVDFDTADWNELYAWQAKGLLGMREIVIDALDLPRHWSRS